MNQLINAIYVELEEISLINWNQIPLANKLIKLELYSIHF